MLKKRMGLWPLWLLCWLCSPLLSSTMTFSFTFLTINNLNWLPRKGLWSHSSSPSFLRNFSINSKNGKAIYQQTVFTTVTRIKHLQKNIISLMIIISVSFISVTGLVTKSQVVASLVNTNYYHCLGCSQNEIRSQHCLVCSEVLRGIIV